MPNCLLFMAWDNNSCPSRAGTWISVIHKSNNFGHQNHLNCYICWYILKDDGSRTNSSVIPHINSLNGQVKTCLDKFPNISQHITSIQPGPNPPKSIRGHKWTALFSSSVAQWCQLLCLGNHHEQIPANEFEEITWCFNGVVFMFSCLFHVVLTFLQIYISKFICLMEHHWWCYVIQS